MIHQTVERDKVNVVELRELGRKKRYRSQL
jgi:hypothetical protein